MAGEIREVRHNVIVISSITAFAEVKGKVRDFCKDVYFVRGLGAYSGLGEDVRQMEDALAAKKAGSFAAYKRVGGLPKLLPDTINACLESFQQWKDSQEVKMYTPSMKRQRDGRGQNTSKGLADLAELEAFAERLGSAFRRIATLFAQSGQVNASQEKNFIVKLICWFDWLGEGWLFLWDGKETVKIVAENVTKKQEYFFYYMLTLLGMDVLLLQCRQDIDAELERLGLSEKFVLGAYGEAALPVFSACPALFPGGEGASSGKGQGGQRALELKGMAPETESARVRVKLPERPGRSKRAAVTVPEHPGRSERAAVIIPEHSGRIRQTAQSSRPGGARREMSFEELARLASSVVMITVHHPSGEPAGSGSGIMVGRGGYILTNHHVAAHGSFYSVSIEGEDRQYRTEDIIKYNSLYDLAVIRIDRRLDPLPVFKGNPPLVRGQKVVAIGSPLGLFNSVSDGIISGFRKIKDVDMIQFTAPISHGSSGGAVLNMFGEVIGISTAGIDDGQNINLAMGYEVINMFIHGFTS